VTSTHSAVPGRVRRAVGPPFYRRDGVGGGIAWRAEIARCAATAIRRDKSCLPWPGAAFSSIVVWVALHRPGRRVVVRSLRNMSMWIALGSVEPLPEAARFDSGLTTGFGHSESSLD
jgi:hypothetical protein